MLGDGPWDAGQLCSRGHRRDLLRRNRPRFPKLRVKAQVSGRLRGGGGPVPWDWRQEHAAVLENLSEQKDDGCHRPVVRDGPSSVGGMLIPETLGLSGRLPVSVSGSTPCPASVPNRGTTGPDGRRGGSDVGRTSCDSEGLLGARQERKATFPSSAVLGGGKREISQNPGGEGGEGGPGASEQVSLAQPLSPRVPPAQGLSPGDQRLQMSFQSGGLGKCL